MVLAVLAYVLFCITGCGTYAEYNIKENSAGKYNAERLYTLNSKINDVIRDPVFGRYGRLIFPADNNYYSGDTLSNLKLAWYSNIDPLKTAEIVNYLKEHAANGETVFFDIYTDEEKSADRRKEKSRAVLFQGQEGGEICCVQCRRRICLCRRNA